MPKEASPVRVKEHTVLQKFEGDPEDGKLLETIEFEDGKVVSVKKEQ